MIAALLGRFGAPLMAQAAVALGIALLVTAGALSGMTYLYLGKRDELAGVRATLTIAQNANDSRRLTIEDLRKANKDFARACEVDVNKQRELVLEVAAQRDSYKDQLTASRHARQELYRANQAAANFAAAVVPPELAARMRDGRSNPTH